MNCFLDTYALIEILNGKKEYLKFLDENIKTGSLNLYELFYNVLKEKGVEEAKIAFSQFKEFIIDFKDEDIFLGSKIKLGNKNLSYADSLGYAISLNNEIPFVTGDKEFKNVNNVIFIK